ncbi:MAG: hypothetical protein HGA85_07085 [Nanoarchaeota archaeon]|nr:hypothetical protein [Nanoarchaeota archaeon]
MTDRTKLIILLVLVVLSIALYNAVQPKPCKSYSVGNCPGSCVVCPPCEVCSSISCQTEEFCSSIGFNRSWHDDMQRPIKDIR